MTRSDKLAWLLALVICLVIPLAMGYYGLALAGGGGLAVLASWLDGQGADFCGGVL